MGSEMCIRDSPLSPLLPCRGEGTTHLPGMPYDMPGGDCPPDYYYYQKTSEDSDSGLTPTISRYSYLPADTALSSLLSTSSPSPHHSFVFGIRGAAKVHYRGLGSECGFGVRGRRAGLFFAFCMFMLARASCSCARVCCVTCVFVEFRCVVPRGCTSTFVAASHAWFAVGSPATMCA